MLSLIIPIAIGAGIGAILSRAAGCSTGACPLVATWKRGALFGGLAGLVVGISLARNGAGSAQHDTPNIVAITEAQFADEVLNAQLPVVVDFYAPWCGPCKVLSPRLDKLAAAHTNDLKFVKVNVDEAKSLAGRYDVQAIPTLMFFRSGKVVDTLVGLPSEETLGARLQALAAPERPKVDEISSR